ncbi:hypothetical protein [Microbispora catharanthi]|uniref:Uncharacterized protein n=1 Tax=Microbispora catharanthi TaxID=1712871 RepID=A0A5N6BZX5_9ACTN|nr:hypothetical protein [Microbispora catharanthi]KAB8185810.1 hypothetical protein FH610_008475 [Microbispora catharanthi]
MSCVSPHVPDRRQPGGKKLAWFGPSDGARVRVLAWTCDCLATVYELCQAGGQGFIRRTLQNEDAPEIRETHRWPIARAREVWAALLTGMAR